MIVGVPRETKAGERRVALLPAAVEEIAAGGHDIHVETRAGREVGFDDDAYRAAGATIVTARDAWDAEVVVKVKEMQPEDLAVAPRGSTVFAFHHLAGEPTRTRTLASHGLTAIAYEAVRDARGHFPLLAPRSRIAGRMSLDVAAQVLGRAPARVLVLGAGHAGLSAARAAVTRGAQVAVLTRSRRGCDTVRAQGIDAEIADAESIERHAMAADLVVGAVFAAGEPTPKLIPRSLLARMKRGAVIVDICIEEGGIAETSRRTSLAEPTYVEEGVVHYCVGNMPSARPAEAAAAISEAALPYVLDMCREGVAAAMLANAELRAGVLLWQGRVTHPAIAAEAGLPYAALTDNDLAEAMP